MPRSLTSIRTAVLCLTIGTAAIAQNAYNYTLKIAGGPTLGGLADVLGRGNRGGLNFGGDFEVAYRRDATSRIAVGLGWRTFPGDFQTLSFIPYSYAATGLNPTVYETRVRKPDAEGFHLTGLYRKDLTNWEGVHWQGGLRIARNRFTETDTGTTLVTDGRASTVTGNVTAVKAIAAMREKASLAIGPMVGLGYEFSDFTVEVNAWSTSFGTPSSGTKSGLATELAFGFRF